MDHRYALNGKLPAVLERLRPICFFNPALPLSYHNRRMLRETLKRIIPNLRLPADMPAY